MYICVMCIRKYMHCIILYFAATCKRPFGPLLLNKMKLSKATRRTILSLKSNVASTKSNVASTLLLV